MKGSEEDLTLNKLPGIEMAKFDSGLQEEDFDYNIEENDILVYTPNNVWISRYILSVVGSCLGVISFCFCGKPLRFQTTIYNSASPP